MKSLKPPLKQPESGKRRNVLTNNKFFTRRNNSGLKDRSYSNQDISRLKKGVMEKESGTIVSHRMKENLHTHESRTELSSHIYPYKSV
jgi:hypothetical protein